MKTFLLITSFLLSAFSYAQSDEQHPGCLDSLITPTSFTPNGDGVSDYFAVYFPCVPDKFKVVVFSRWGTEIYTSKYPGFQWDGKTADGENVESGVFYFVITFTYFKEETELTGYITLIR